jgi:glycosyltransferase involved in cell wall biosynthesis
MDQPLVSVVVPTHNCAPFLAEAIESALAQSHRRIEIIVVDDGSTDATADVLNQYASRVSVIRQPNEGVSAARNVGIRASHGEYIALLDADDAWHPEKLTRQLALFRAPSVGLVHCAMLYVDEQGHVSGTNRTGRRGRVLRDMALLQGTVVQGGGSGALVRSSVFKAVGLFNTTLSTSADWDMWRRIACHYEIEMVPKPLVRYRLREGSMHRNVALFEHDMLAAFAMMFADPAAAEVHPLRKRAYSKLYMMLSGSYLHAGGWTKSVKYIARSVATWPPNVRYLAEFPLRIVRRLRTPGEDVEPGL